MYAKTWFKLDPSFITTVKCAGSRPAYFAERLYLSMKVQYLYKIFLNKHMQDSVPLSGPSFNDSFLPIRVKVPAKKPWPASWWAALKSTWNASRMSTRRATAKHSTRKFWWVTTDTDYRDFTKEFVLKLNLHTFFSFLQDDTKGDYEKILLALCGGDN